jgi:hypothetical protein
LIHAANVLGLSNTSMQHVPQGDEDSYLRAAGGLLDKFGFQPYPYSDVRPYCYPLFLVLPVWIGRVFQIDPRIPATIAQAAIYLGAAVALCLEISVVNQTFGAVALFGGSALAVSYRKNFGRLAAAGALSAVVFASALATQAHLNRYHCDSTNLIAEIDIGTLQQGLGVLLLK